jgi:hypothetical protein
MNQWAIKALLCVVFFFPSMAFLSRFLHVGVDQGLARAFSKSIAGPTLAGLSRKSIDEVASAVSAHRVYQKS